MLLKKIIFENYKDCLEASQVENNIKHLVKNRTNIYHIKENHKEFIKSSNSISRKQQRFKSERY